MIEDSIPSLGDALIAFQSSRKGGQQQEGGQYLNGFIQWCGRERDVRELTPPEVASYVERYAYSGSSAHSRVQPVKEFLIFLKKQGWITISLAPHLRLPKRKKTSKLVANDSQSQLRYLTEEGHANLKQRLASFKSESVAIVADIKRAMADKDFRENAPLDAAKERQGFIEANIRELQDVLSKAVVGSPNDANANTRLTSVGHRVTLRDLGNGKKVIYTLVDSREADPSSGKISSISPVGRALLGKALGSEIQINVPKGILSYVIEKIDKG